MFGERCIPSRRSHGENRRAILLADIRALLEKFYRPGDTLRLVRSFKVKEPLKCQMCGDIVSIWNCYELRNKRTGQSIICGCNCIVKYANVVRIMGEVPHIVFPARYHEQAEKINRKRPDTVIIEPIPDDYRMILKKNRVGICVIAVSRYPSVPIATTKYARSANEAAPVTAANTLIPSTAITTRS